MFTMILISSVAVFVALLGSALIWGLDALRADEIERATLPAVDPPAALPSRAR
ncbi:hypothetical protein [Nocardioides seonyuensis]|uniref:hypothetical protein n=1 Tax=Nocardioides seonyuensis TaxID=2518371 RepID=UPI0014226F45|nr:hypothetical protein [Nocardioides seonyuensis]